jgi:hypothetical protein
MTQEELLHDQEDDGRIVFEGRDAQMRACLEVDGDDDDGTTFMLALIP